MPTAQPIESLTRVWCHLPNKTLAQKLAFNRIVGHVKRLKDSNAQITGFTQLEDALGQWWSADDAKWVDDTVTILIVDFSTGKAPERLAGRIAGIKRIAHCSYSHYKDPQQEIWVVAHPIDRY